MEQKHPHRVAIEYLVMALSTSGFVIDESKLKAAEAILRCDYYAMMPPEEYPESQIGTFESNRVHPLSWEDRIADKLKAIKYRNFPNWSPLMGGFTVVGFVGYPELEPGLTAQGSLIITIEDACAAVGEEVPKPKMKVTYKRFGGEPAMAIDREINKAIYESGTPRQMFHDMPVEEVAAWLNKCEFGNCDTWQWDEKNKTFSNKSGILLPTDAVIQLLDLTAKLRTDKTTPVNPYECKIHRIALYPDGICPICDYEKHRDPMTLERAVEVLNEHMYLNHQWALVQIFDVPYAEAITNPNIRKGIFELLAIAEKLERGSK